MLTWAWGIISACGVICLCDILRNTACKHVACRRILRGSSIVLQLDMSHRCGRDSKPRAMGQRSANIINPLEHPRWCPQGWFGAEGRKAACREIIPLGWWRAAGKGRGKESRVYNCSVGCARMTAVLGSGMSSLGCSDRPCLIWVPACQLGCNPVLRKNLNI